ncbi:MAG: AAA family ATPase [archaeon]
MDWTEKYRPVSLDDISMNNDIRKKLNDFSKLWVNDKPQKPLILWGNAGVGKTTSALALANDYGFNPIEVNASNSRTKSDLQDLVGVSSYNYSMSSFVEGDGEKKLNLLIVDEADNLESKSGSNELIKIINNSIMPIILIANDFYSMDRNLRNVCQSIRFDNLSEINVVNTLGKILERENIVDVDGSTKVIANKCNGDMRSAIKILQSSVDFDSQTISKNDIVCNTYVSKLSSFELMNGVFKANNCQETYWNLNNSDDIPSNNITWIEQNIFTVFNAKRDIDDIVKVYNLLSTTDICNSRVYSRQRYRLWKHINPLLSMINHYSVKNNYNCGFTKFSFPEHLKILSQNKEHRKNLDVLSGKIAEYTHTSKSNIKKDLKMYKEIFNHNLGYYIYLFNLDRTLVKTLYSNTINDERIDYEMERAERFRLENEIKELNNTLNVFDDLSEDDIQNIIEDKEENLGKSKQSEEQKVAKDQMDFSAFM